MNNKHTLYAAFALTVALVLPGALMAEQSDQAKLRKEAVDLTKSIERSSLKIQKEAHRLDAMKRSSRYANRTHQNSLSQIARQVNEGLQPDLKRLNEIKPELPQWHQDAIDQMQASAATVAANANAAINNRNPSDTHRPAVMDENYGELIGNMVDHSTDLVEVADATGDYGTAQMKGLDAGLAITTHD